MRTIGYLCSEYPAISHTFISREIAILEAEGFKIHTASINPTKNAESLGEADRARAAGTYYIKSTPRHAIAAKFLRRLVRLPSFFSSLGYSLRLSWLGGPRSLVKATGYFIQALLLSEWAKENRIRHIHVHFANPASTVAMIAARLGGIEFSLSVHGPDEFYNVDANNLREKVQSAVFVRCIGFFCQSQLMRITPTSQWSKFRIVRCGLYRDEIVPRPPRTGPVRRILCVGRLCPSKGQVILLDAAKSLRSKGLDFDLVFLGGGEDLDMIREKVETEGLSDRVTVAGPVSHAIVKDELAKADIFALPSFAEGIPVALMEAMAAGIPVVSTRIAGIPELIEDKKEGFLVPASSVERLSEVIEGLLRGEADTAAIVKAASDKVRSSYDVEANTRELGRIFDAIQE
jgi:colanic acid/amylovoran biosynthesis glycosyltransferase